MRGIETYSGSMKAATRLFLKTHALPGTIALLLAVTSATLPAHAAGDYPPAPRLEQGQSLRTAITDLAKTAGMKLDWGIKEDYWLEYDLDLPGKGLAEDVQWAIDSYKSKGAMARVLARVEGRTLKVGRMQRDPSLALATPGPSLPVRPEALALESHPPRAAATSPQRKTAASKLPAATAAVSPAASTPALVPMAKDSTMSVPALVAPAPAAMAPPAQTWVARNGSTLQTAVKDWTQKAGWTLIWNDKRPDLEIVGNVEVKGDVVKAVSYLFDVYRRSGASYTVDIYTQQKLVLVKEK